MKVASIASVVLTGAVLVAAAAHFAPNLMPTPATAIASPVDGPIARPDSVQQASQPTRLAQTQPTPAVTPPTAPVDQKTLSEGSFRNGSPGHNGAGKVKIVKTGNATVLQLSQFNTTPGPDLKVWLVAKDDIKKERDVTASKYVEISELKSPNGDQSYTIAENVDISQYKSVVIWCKTFGVLFSSAQLKPAS